MRCIPYNPLKAGCHHLLLVIITLTSFMVMASASTVNTAHLLTEYQRLHPIDVAQLKRQLQQKIKQLEQTPIDMTAIQPPHTITVSMYPVTSTLLTPGNVATRNVNLSLVQPLFLIGNDSFSKKWLIKFAKQLQQLKATGFVVNIDNGQALQQLRQLAPSVTLVPLPADSLAKKLHLHHYPVLVSHHLIEQ